MLFKTKKLDLSAEYPELPPGIFVKAVPMAYMPSGHMEMLVGMSDLADADMGQQLRMIEETLAPMIVEWNITDDENVPLPVPKKDRSTPAVAATATTEAIPEHRGVMWQIPIGVSMWILGELSEEEEGAIPPANGVESSKPLSLPETTPPSSLDGQLSTETLGQATVTVPEADSLFHIGTR